MRYANNVNGNLVFRESLQYRYDCMGNIVEVFENGRSLYRYEYDALGRLTREDNQAFKTTKQYVYDNNGNIIAKYQYPITTTPTNELQWLTAEKSTQYGYATNSDRLMTYGAETFAYDAIGNPTTYRGKTATWKNGRQLTAYNGTTFAYDARGRRTQKNTLTFTYDSKGNLLKQSNGLEFLYDHTGIFAVKQGNSTYYCRKNAQNDVMFLLDNNGTIVVKYRYDAWGNCKVLNASENEITDANHIGNLNPFRYRSYYYDTETKLYFLQSRYYDPEVGRFITIDDISYLDPDSINGLNLYAYCKNNPVIGYDPTGTWDWGTFWRAFGSTVAIVGGIALCFVPGAQLIGAGLIIAGAGGLIGGAIGAATGAGFNYGWDIGTIIGGSIGLVVALPQLLSLSFTASIPMVSQMLTTAGELVLVTSSIAVAIPVGGAVAVAAGVGIVMFAKQSRKSKSDMSTDIPSWVNPKLLDPNKSAQQNVIDLLNEKYGPGNWRYGPDTEYNKIKKWLRRKLGWKG